MRKCGEAFELMRLKDLLMSNAKLAGSVFPVSSGLIEPTYIRHDKTRPGNIYALGMGVHMKDSVMYVVVASALTVSWLTSSSKSSNIVLR
jgi:hypothetical protein